MDAADACTFDVPKSTEFGAIGDVGFQARGEQHIRSSSASAEGWNPSFAKTRGHCLTCPPGARCRRLELSMPQTSRAPCDQDPCLASYRRKQARSRNMTPPPAPCRGSLPAVQPCPASKADVQQQVDDQQQAKLAHCRRFGKLMLAMPVLMLVLLGLSPCFQSGTAEDFIPVQKLSAFASAKGAVLKYPMHDVVVFTDSAKQAVLVLVEQSPALQRLAELKTSAKKALLEHLEESCVLQRVLKFALSAREAVSNFCTGCMLRRWANSTSFAMEPSPPEAVVRARPISQACVSGRCASVPLETYESVCINFQPRGAGERPEDGSRSISC